MQPMFITNDAEIQRLEGLYIKERNPPAVIAGVFLGGTGIVGEAVRGPVDRVVEVSSPARFSEVFGGKSRSGTGAITSTLWKALLNKKFGKLYIVRAAAAGATTGTRTVSDATPTAIVRMDANGPGDFSGDVTTQVKAASDANANHWNLDVTYNGRTTTFRNLDTTAGNNNLVAVIGTDEGNVVILTKLADGRPVNDVAPVALSTGTNGTIADSDFTATGRGLNLLAKYSGIGTVFVAERDSALLKAQTLIIAAGATDRMFVVGAASETLNVTSAAADAATIRNDAGRVIYAYNHVYTIDPDTSVEVLTSPTAWMASILSQVDVDIDPGEEDTKVLLAGVTRLYNEGLAREDYITLREAGISALEHDEGFSFVSSVTTSLVSGKERIVRRRSVDFLQLSMAKALRPSVKKKNTLARRMANAGMLQGFLKELADAGRVVDKDQYSVDTDSLNTDNQRAQGIERIFTRARLIPHMLELVLETEIGTTVTVKEAA